MTHHWLVEQDGGALWRRHHGPVRAFVQGLAEGFEADPERRWSGREVAALLRANLDLADAQNDLFDDAPGAGDD